MIKQIVSVTLAFSLASSLYGAESKPKKQTKTSAKSSKEQVKNTNKIVNYEFEVSQSSEMPPVPKSPIPPLVRDEAKETVYDPTTKLMWQDNSESIIRNWQNAITYCDNLTLGGYSDWRLPEIKELLSINDTTQYEPAIKNGFQNVVTSYYYDYWSSSTTASSSDDAWTANFRRGGSGNIAKYSYDMSVRCVRDSN